MLLEKKLEHMTVLNAVCMTLSKGTETSLKIN